MVSRKTNKRKTIKSKSELELNSKNKSKISFKFIFCFVLIGIAIAGLVFLALSFIFKKDTEIIADNTEIVEKKDEEPEEEIVVLPPKIDFQSIVDDWANTTGGVKSVIIYDLERDEMVGEYNPEESYNTASLYKLFVVYEGYRRIQVGEWQPDEMAGSTGYTVLKCLDLAIRESHSPCAETLWSKIGRVELDNIITNDFHITDSNISNLISNPRDILSILKIFYSHDDIKDESLITQMKDSFLIQPPTTYNWRQGLPSGFTQAKVYNKVGWDYNPDGKYWNIYHDAAIVEFPDSNRHYIVVVMSNRLPFQNIRQLGANIEKHFIANSNQ